MEQIKGHLGSLDTLLNELDRIIDDQLARGSTMVANATTKCRDVGLRMRRSLSSLAAVDETKPSSGSATPSAPELFQTEEPQ
jgi:hypothetical protein